MTALIRGELIKTVSTRTALGFLAIGAALAVVNVVIGSQFSVLDTVSDKRDALAGLSVPFLLFWVVGARGPTAATGPPYRRLSWPGTVADGCCSLGRARTLPPASRSQR